MRSGRMPLSSTEKASGTFLRSLLALDRLPDTCLDGKIARAYHPTLSRGHLSRSACRHVKQGAKRPGTRVPGQDFFLGRFFIGHSLVQEAAMSASSDRKFRPETRLVHAGTLRS